MWPGDIIQHKLCSGPLIRLNTSIMSDCSEAHGNGVSLIPQWVGPVGWEIWLYSPNYQTVDELLLGHSFLINRHKIIIYASQGYG